MSRRVFVTGDTGYLGRALIETLVHRGHHVRALVVPLYGVARHVPAWRATAGRLGLVTHEQMVRALVAAVENPVQGVRIVEVPGIRRGLVSATH